MKPKPASASALFPMFVTIRDEHGQPVQGVNAVCHPDLIEGGEPIVGEWWNDVQYVFKFPAYLTGTGSGFTAEFPGYQVYVNRFIASADNAQIIFDDGHLEVHLVPVPPPPPEPGPYKLPSEYTIEELLAVRAAIWTHPLPNRYGPRPGQSSNLTALCYNDSYSLDEQEAQFASYRARGLTHAAVGPLTDTGYHDLWPRPDYRHNFDGFLNLVERYWQHGIIPMVFLHLDNQSFDEFYAMYDPLIRGNPRAADLLRFVVPSGWEPTQYGWSSKTWARYVAWAREVLPNATVWVHTVADCDAPTGVDELHNDNNNPNGHADAWANVCPYIHGWLSQQRTFEDPDSHGDPNHPEKTNYENWLDLWRESVDKSLTNRFRNGYAGWPTYSARGAVPIRVIAFEYCSYWVCWDNRPASEGDSWGDAAIAAGADGYGDGGTRRGSGAVTANRRRPDADADDGLDLPRSPMSGDGWTPWMRFTAFVGVPSMIALGLIYFLTQVVLNQLNVNLAAIKIAGENSATGIAVSREIQQRIALLDDSVDRARDRQETMLAYMRAICVNSARTTEDRQRCLLP